MYSHSKPSHPQRDVSDPWWKRDKLKKKHLSCSFFFSRPSHAANVNCSGTLKVLCQTMTDISTTRVSVSPVASVARLVVKGRCRAVVVFLSALPALKKTTKSLERETRVLSRLLTRCGSRGHPRESPWVPTCHPWQLPACKFGTAHCSGTQSSSVGSRSDCSS